MGDHDEQRDIQQPLNLQVQGFERGRIARNVSSLNFCGVIETVP
jgi:hypothetical protein